MTLLFEETTFASLYRTNRSCCPRRPKQSGRGAQGAYIAPVQPVRGKHPHAVDCSRHAPGSHRSWDGSGGKNSSSYRENPMLSYYNNIWEAFATARVREAREVPR